MSLTRRKIFYPVAVLWIFYLGCLTVTRGQETTTAEADLTTFQSDEASAPLFYDDQEPPPPVMLIRMCHCHLTEYLTEDGQCVEHQTLVDSTSGDRHNGTVEDLICPADMASATLPKNTVMPLDGGGIYIHGAELFLASDSYCFVHKMDASGSIFTETKICVPVPTLPKCCQSESKLAVEESATGGHFVSCTNQSEVDQMESLPFDPPVTIEFVPLKWNNSMYEVSPISCLPGHELISARIEGAADVHLAHFGTLAHLFWSSPNNAVIRMNPAEFCIEAEENNENNVEYISYFCYLDPVRVHNETCENKTCVRKCCNLGEVLHVSQGCISWNNTDNWMPAMYNSDSLEVTQENVTVTTVSGFPICPDLSHPLTHTDPFVLQDDGFLRVLTLELFSPLRYCLDTFVGDDETTELSGVVCFSHSEEDECVWQKILQMVVLAFSCVFIVATLFVYLSVGDIRRKLASKCVISESLALLFSFLSLIVLQSIGGMEPTNFCIFIGLLFYYSILASFFWLNVMCFDMYFTINSMLPVRESGSKMSWFVRYSLYGWGMPLLFLIAVCVCDNLPVNVYFVNVIRPGIFISCHIANQNYTARWAYVYGIMLVLLVVNVLLFIHVAVLLVRQQRESAKMLQGAESQTRQGGGAATNSKAKESALLCLKLFMVMGVTWVTEILSFAEGENCYVWLATDIINCLRGFFIFLIFVCKRDILKKFKSTWRPQLALVRGVCCPSAATSQAHPENSSQATSSAFWPSRKTSNTSLFSIGPKRKVSTASARAVELQKMETFSEEDEAKKDGDVKF